jgi:hypothetical protein
MDPLPPNDPLWRLLGQSRRVEVRPDFTRNVLRAARQTPQEQGWFVRLRGWLSVSSGPKLAWATAAAALAAGLMLMSSGAPDPELARQSVEVPDLLLETDFPMVDGYDTQWQNLEQMGDLLAVQDSALLTDREIHLLLY